MKWKVMLDVGSLLKSQLLFVLEDGFYKSTRYLPSDAQLFLQEMSTQLLGYLSSRGRLVILDF